MEGLQQFMGRGRGIAQSPMQQRIGDQQIAEVVMDVGIRGNPNRYQGRHKESDNAWR
jgi:hypothetical protein